MIFMALPANKYWYLFLEILTHSRRSSSCQMAEGRLPGGNDTLAELHPVVLVRAAYFLDEAVDAEAF